MTTTHAFRPQWQAKNLCAFEFEDKSVCLLEKGRHQYELQPKIEIEVWKPDPDSKYPGTVILDYRRKVQDVLDELNAKLIDEGIEPDEYGFTNMTKYDDPAYRPPRYGHSIAWPMGRWISVFPVTGGSEGHYIHIEVIGEGDGPPPQGPRGRVSRLIGLAKTFRGWDHACRISAAAARLLQA